MGEYHGNKYQICKRYLGDYWIGLNDNQPVEIFDTEDEAVEYYISLEPLQEEE